MSLLGEALVFELMYFLFLIVIVPCFELDTGWTGLAEGTFSSSFSDDLFSIRLKIIRCLLNLILRIRNVEFEFSESRRAKSTARMTIEKTDKPKLAVSVTLQTDCLFRCATHRRE